MVKIVGSKKEMAKRKATAVSSIFLKICLRLFGFFLYVALMLMPFQVTLVPNYLVADWLHILDTRWSIMLPGFFAPFSVYLLTKFMRRIPNSLIEAAKLDGANEWQIFSRICVPLCKGSIASVAILVFIDYWNMVEQPLIMTLTLLDTVPELTGSVATSGRE